MKKYRNKRNSAYADIYISAKLLSPLTLEEMEENKLLSLDLFYDLMEEAVKKKETMFIADMANIIICFTDQQIRKSCVVSI